MGSIDLFEDFTEENDAHDVGLDDDPDNESGPNQNEDDDEQKEKVEAKVKVVRIKRKIATLNVERLKGARGIIAIDDFFQNVKFKGKGFEKHDLNETMKRLEHWSHRMFPKFNFDDSLTAIDRLGKKREISVHMSRYRLDQLTKDDDQIISDGENKDEDLLAEELPVDEFEEMINEQIALSNAHSRTNAGVMDTSVGDISGIIKYRDDTIPFQSSQSSSQMPVLSQSPISQSAPQTQLSEEARARIAENKQRALAIREARLREAEEKRKQKETAGKQKNSQNFPSEMEVHIDDD